MNPGWQNQEQKIPCGCVWDDFVTELNPGYKSETKQKVECEEHVIKIDIEEMEKEGFVSPKKIFLRKIAENILELKKLKALPQSVGRDMEIESLEEEYQDNARFLALSIKGGF